MFIEPRRNKRLAPEERQLSGAAAALLELGSDACNPYKHCAPLEREACVETNAGKLAVLW